MLSTSVPVAPENVEEQEATSEENAERPEDSERRQRAAGVAMMVVIAYGVVVGLVRLFAPPILEQFAQIEQGSQAYAVGFGLVVAVPAIAAAIIGGNLLAKNPQVWLVASGFWTAVVIGLLSGVAGAFTIWDYIRLIPELVSPEFTVSLLLAHAAIPPVGFIVGALLHRQPPEE